MKIGVNILREKHDVLVEVREVEKLFNMSSLKIGIQGFENAVLKIIIKKIK